MLECEKSVTLADFREDPISTIDRLNQTGEAEVLTVDGKAKVVLVAPAQFSEMKRELDEAHIESLRRAAKDIDEGRGRDAFAFLDEVRARLLAMKSAASGVVKK